MRALILLGCLALAACDAPAHTSRIDRRECQQIPNTAVIVIDGQSNAANHGLGRYSATKDVLNFDPTNGRCVSAVDPLLGSDGDGANFATRLGDILIQSGRFDRVILVPVAIGGMSITQLAGDKMHRIDQAIRAMRAAKLNPTHILFQQGESDGTLKTTPEEYAAKVRSIVSRYREAGIEAPFYVAKASRCDLIKPTNTDAVRKGQEASLDTALGIVQGPDIDMVGPGGRNPVDGCHLSEIGVIATAALWAAFLR